MITTYTGSDGKGIYIKEMNNFHLVNAFIKVVGLVAVAKELSSVPNLIPTFEALKAEILTRLNPEK